MVIDFTSLILQALALYVLGGILIAAVVGCGVWTLQKFLNRKCEEIRKQEAKQKMVSPQFVKPLA